MLRPMLFVAMSRSVRRSFRCFIRVIPAVADIVMLVIILLVLFGIAGVILFADLSPYEAASTADLGSYETAFNTFPRALLSLFTLLTTANFPDVMLPFFQAGPVHRASTPGSPPKYPGLVPALVTTSPSLMYLIYDHSSGPCLQSSRPPQVSRASCIFFVLFLVLGLFLLMNLVLAAVIHDYKKQVLASAKKARERRDLALAAAFGLLDLNGNGFVDLVEFSQLLQRLHAPVFSLFDGRRGPDLPAALLPSPPYPTATPAPPRPLSPLCSPRRLSPPLPIRFQPVRIRICIHTPSSAP